MEVEFIISRKCLCKTDSKNRMKQSMKVWELNKCNCWYKEGCSLWIWIAFFDLKFKTNWGVIQNKKICWTQGATMSEFCRCSKMWEALSLVKCSFTRVEKCPSVSPKVKADCSCTCITEDDKGFCWNMLYKLKSVAVFIKFFICYTILLESLHLKTVLPL